MHSIKRKKQLTPLTFEFHIEAPEVIRNARPGQFVVIRITEQGERIPLTIADYDEHLVLVVQVVGGTTDELSRLEEGDQIHDVCGPLGHPMEPKEGKTIALIGGGCGIAAIYPEARELSKNNKVISIIGARSSELLFWKEKMRSVSDELIIYTDDGSEGRKGLVTDAVEGLQADEIIAIGPMPMMRAVSEASDVKTTVSLNPIMIDGIGMCGACRVRVGDQTRFTCVDGPEFDGHEVDWDMAMNRCKCEDD